MLVLSFYGLSDGFQLAEGNWGRRTGSPLKKMKLQRVKNRSARFRYMGTLLVLLTGKMARIGAKGLLVKQIFLSTGNLTPNPG